MKMGGFIVVKILSKTFRIRKLELRPVKILTNALRINSTKEGVSATARNRRAAHFTQVCEEQKFLLI